MQKNVLGAQATMYIVHIHESGATVKILTLLSPSHVEPGQHSVPSLVTQACQEGSTSVFRAKVVIFLTLCAHLTTQTGNLVEEVAKQLNTRTPVKKENSIIMWCLRTKGNPILMPLPLF